MWLNNALSVFQLLKTDWSSFDFYSETFLVFICPWNCPVRPLQSITFLKCCQVKGVNIPTEAALLPNADAIWHPCCCFTFCNYTPEDHLCDPTIAIASTISHTFWKAASKFTCKRTPGDSPDPVCSLHNKSVCLDFTDTETGMWETTGAYPGSMLIRGRLMAGAGTCI